MVTRKCYAFPVSRKWYLDGFISGPKTTCPQANINSAAKKMCGLLIHDRNICVKPQYTVNPNNLILFMLTMLGSTHLGQSFLSKFKYPANWYALEFDHLCVYIEDITMDGWFGEVLSLMFSFFFSSSWLMWPQFAAEVVWFLRREVDTFMMK